MERLEKGKDLSPLMTLGTRKPSTNSIRATLPQEAVVWWLMSVKIPRWTLYFPLLHALLRGKSILTWAGLMKGWKFSHDQCWPAFERFEAYVQQEGQSETKDCWGGSCDLVNNWVKAILNLEARTGKCFLSKGGSHPEKIFVLADVYCASSGAQFVQMT